MNWCKNSASSSLWIFSLYPFSTSGVVQVGQLARTDLPWCGYFLLRLSLGEQRRITLAGIWLSEGKWKWWVSTPTYFSERPSSLRRGFPSDSVVKNPPATARAPGDAGSIPGSGRSPGGGHGNPLQHSCLENPMDGGVMELDMTKWTEHINILFLGECKARSCREISKFGEKSPN